MSRFPSFKDLKKFSLTGHTYNTQDDLKYLTPEDIIKLDVKSIPEFIVNYPATPPLSLTQQGALKRLLARKRLTKQGQNIDTPKFRQQEATEFLKETEGNSEADAYIKELIPEILADAQKKIEHDIKKAIDENRNMNYDPNPKPSERHIFTPEELTYLKNISRNPENFKQIFDYSLDALIDQNIGLRKEQFKGGKRTRKYRKGSKRRFNKKSSRKNKKITHKRKY